MISGFKSRTPEEHNKSASCQNYIGKLVAYIIAAWPPRKTQKHKLDEVYNGRASLVRNLKNSTQAMISLKINLNVFFFKLI